METMPFLANQFVFLSAIIIPAGTPFVTEEPGTGIQHTKRRLTNKVYLTGKGFAQHMPDGLYVDEPYVEVAPNSGWLKKFTVTEELLTVNGFTPTFENIRVRPMPETASV